MLQTTVNMCKTGHNIMTFTAVEQKIAWEYLEAYLRYRNFIKSAYFKHFVHFAAIEKFKTTNFAANHCEYVCNWSQLYDFHHH